jgi:hypothetical protein
VKEKIHAALTSATLLILIGFASFSRQSSKSAALFILPRTVTFQLMKSVTRRHSQIRQTFGRVQHQELSSRWLSNVHELTNILIVEKPLRVGALEGPFTSRGYNPAH